MDVKQMIESGRLLVDAVEIVLERVEGLETKMSSMQAMHRQMMSGLSELRKQNESAGASPRTIGLSEARPLLGREEG